MGYDDSFHGNATLELVGWEYPRVGTVATTPAQVLATAATGLGPTPGMSTFCATLTAPILIKSFGDLNANGVPGWTGYALRGTLTYLPGGGVDAPRRVGVLRRRGRGLAAGTVSPAPAVAVQRTSRRRIRNSRWVEALVASGITGGCAADKYLPGRGDHPRPVRGLPRRRAGPADFLNPSWSQMALPPSPSACTSRTDRDRADQFTTNEKRWLSAPAVMVPVCVARTTFPRETVRVKDTVRGSSQLGLLFAQ